MDVCEICLTTKDIHTTRLECGDEFILCIPCVDERLFNKNIPFIFVGEEGEYKGQYYGKGRWLVIEVSSDFADVTISSDEEVTTVDWLGPGDPVPVKKKLPYPCPCGDWAEEIEVERDWLAKEQHDRLWECSCGATGESAWFGLSGEEE